MKPTETPASSAPTCELALARTTILATNSGGTGLLPGSAHDARAQVAAGPRLYRRRDQQGGDAGPGERRQACCR